MSEATELTKRNLAELAVFLYREGTAALQHGAFRHARTWHTQCLHVFSDIGGNDIWIAKILTLLGIETARLSFEHALTFFAASRDILESLNNQEMAADSLLDLGKEISAMGSPVPSIYQMLSERLAATTPVLADEVNQPHQFAIYINDKHMQNLIVGADGSIHWSMVGRLDHPIAFGLNSLWEVKHIGH